MKVIPFVHNQYACSCHFERSEVEKSGFRLTLLFIRSQISPLRAALRPAVEMTKAQILITVDIIAYKL